MRIRPIWNLKQLTFGKTAKRFAGCCLAIVVTLSSALVGLAGGFHLSVEIPPPSSDSQLKEAVLLVRAYGCHQPSEAALSATAEGIVGGQRKSVPLELTSIEKGVYAIKRQWPAEGAWVLAITGTYLGRTSSALVELGPGGEVQARGRLIAPKSNGLSVRYFSRKLTAK
jgi:hypothetical protein